MGANLTGTLSQNLPISHIDDDDFGLNSELTRIWSHLHNTKHDIMQRLISSGQKLRENFTIKLNIPNFELPEDAQAWALQRLQEVENNLHHLTMHALTGNDVFINCEVECTALSKPLCVDSPIHDFDTFNVVVEYIYDKNNEHRNRKLNVYCDDIGKKLYHFGVDNFSIRRILWFMVLFVQMVALAASIAIELYDNTSVLAPFILFTIPLVLIWATVYEKIPGQKEARIRDFKKQMREDNLKINGNPFVLTKVEDFGDYPIKGYVVVKDTLLKDGMTICPPTLKMCSWNFRGETDNGQYNIDFKNISASTKEMPRLTCEGNKDMGVKLQLRDEVVCVENKINKFPFAIRMIATRKHI